MKDFVANAVVLQVVHHVCTIPLQEWPYTPDKRTQIDTLLKHGPMQLHILQPGRCAVEPCDAPEWTACLLKSISKAISVVWMISIELHVHVFPRTLTCSLEVTAQNTISAKFWVGNMRKQMPPITLFSLIRASEWCFLHEGGGAPQNTTCTWTT